MVLAVQRDQPPAIEDGVLAVGGQRRIKRDGDGVRAAGKLDVPPLIERVLHPCLGAVGDGGGVGEGDRLDGWLANGEAAPKMDGRGHGCGRGQGHAQTKQYKSKEEINVFHGVPLGCVANECGLVYPTQM